MSSVPYLGPEAGSLVWKVRSGAYPIKLVPKTYLFETEPESKPRSKQSPGYGSDSEPELVPRPDEHNARSSDSEESSDDESESDTESDDDEVYFRKVV